MSPTADRCQVAIVGAGFAGALLARVLARLGYAVALLERGRHPRFAIGESSTPLANLALERLAARYDLPDLHALAAHGRWVRAYPALRRGLKRGFTFYRHHPGLEYENDAANGARLLIAASPSDDVADTHWLREDVDHHFVRQAVQAGVDYRDGVELSDLAAGQGSVVLAGSRAGRSFRLRADFVVDASGPGGFLRRHVPIPSALRTTRTRSALLFGHFDRVRPFAEVAPVGEPGPYPDDWAAVHHVLDEGWMYALRFDDGLVSAGVLLTPVGLGALGDPDVAARPAEAWQAVLRRYPSLGRQFAQAAARFPIGFRPRVQHRLARAAGAWWVVLPHAYAFVDPLFSTGIAWTLLGVERLALSFEEAAAGRTRAGPAPKALARYERVLPREADQIDRLVAGAYLASVDFDLYAAQAMLYFAAVSYAEARQRLVDRDRPWAWDGLLGVGDPVLDRLIPEACRRLNRVTGGGRRVPRAGERAEFARWVAEGIAPRNVAGLADPTRRNLYPVDLDVLLDRCHLLGMTRDAFERARPRLRGRPSAVAGVA